MPDSFQYYPFEKIKRPCKSEKARKIAYTKLRNHSVVAKKKVLKYY